MNAKDCILGRRSIRRFKPDPVPHDVLEEIIELASYAPIKKSDCHGRHIYLSGKWQNYRTGTYADRCYRYQKPQRF